MPAVDEDEAGSIEGRAGSNEWCRSKKHSHLLEQDGAQPAASIE
jgi:hypothetical protein